MKLRVMLFSILSTLAVLVNAFTVDNSTVALWDYTAGSGSVDLSANKLNGTLTNVQTKDGAAYFDGSSSFAQYPSLDSRLGKSALTLETEIKISSISSWLTTVLGYAAWDSQTYGYELRLRNIGDSVYVELCVGSAVYDGWDVITSPSALKLNTWYKVAAQFDGSSLAIFINDKLVVSKTHSALLNFYNAKFTVGMRAPGTPDFPFNGYVKQVRVSNIARYSLSDNKRTLFETDVNTVAHWTFNEMSGNTSKDISGNGHDAVFNKVPAWTLSRYGGGVQFDGSTWAVVANKGEFNFNGSFRIDVATRNPFPQKGRYVSNHQQAINTGYIFASRDSRGFTFEAYDGQNKLLAESAGAHWQPDSNYIVSLVYSQTNKKLTYFCNDVNVGEFTIDMSVVKYSQTPFIIGAELAFADSQPGIAPFYGLIDEIKVSEYDRAYVPELVSPINEESVTFKEQLLWRCNGSSSVFDVMLSTLPDFSQNTFTAQVNGKASLLSSLSCARNLPRLVHLFWKVKVHGVADAKWSNVGSFYIVESPTQAELLKEALRNGGVSVSPNPLKSNASITVFQKEHGLLEVTVHDIRGNLIERINTNKNTSIGFHKFSWNTIDKASGVYLVKVASGSRTEIKKVLFSK
ncbi:MAG: T9SS type A sorting domain-containing protein [Fibrobacteres bacterium]|nr:T9SS type A sorting domain-containing protein [Fibrobacterota bacterium]